MIADNVGNIGDIDGEIITIIQIKKGMPINLIIY